MVWPLVKAHCHSTTLAVAALLVYKMHACV